MIWNTPDWQAYWSKKQWMDWIQGHWPGLLAGAKIQAPYGFSSPNAAGFTLLPVAHPVGQSRDWSLSMSDGSRIHVHEFPDGRYVTHRDKHDPAQGFERSVAHLMQETPYPAWVAIAGLGFLFVKAFDG
jgi:hypothetical protein